VLNDYNLSSSSKVKNKHCSCPHKGPPDSLRNENLPSRIAPPTLNLNFIPRYMTHRAASPIYFLIYDAMCIIKNVIFYNFDTQ